MVFFSFVLYQILHLNIRILCCSQTTNPKAKLGEDLESNMEEYILEGYTFQQNRIPPNRWDPTSVGEENEVFFIRVWKPLSNKHVLKTLRGSPKGKTQKRTISASGGLKHPYLYIECTQNNPDKKAKFFSKVP